MKKIAALILGILFAIQSFTALAEVRQPALPAELHKFVIYKEYDFTGCGPINLYIFFEDKITWGIFLENRELEDAYSLNPFVVLKQTFGAGASKEYWVDKNRDGIFDEYYPSASEMDRKYPDICTAIVYPWF